MRHSMLQDMFGDTLDHVVIRPYDQKQITANSLYWNARLMCVVLLGVSQVGIDLK